MLCWTELLLGHVLSYLGNKVRARLVDHITFKLRVILLVLLLLLDKSYGPVIAA